MFVIASIRSETFGAVVQLVRMPACHAGGREFESRPLRKEKVRLRRIFSYSSQLPELAERNGKSIRRSERENVLSVVQKETALIVLSTLPG